MKVAVYSKLSIINNPAKAKIVDGLKKLADFDVYEVDDVSQNTDADCLLVFGGDGTMLYAGVNSPVKILGINLGYVGFLAEFEVETDVKIIADALKNAPVKSRFLLQTSISDNDILALNDISIKSIGSRPAKLSLYVDGQYVDKYHADGLIISTPTGSTAYSLSAGGPVLAPNVEAIEVNPICPHSLHSRALVLAPTSKIAIKVDNGCKCMVVADGNECGIINSGEVVNISRSQKNALFIENTSNNFYNKLLDKMNRWGVTD